MFSTVRGSVAFRELLYSLHEGIHRARYDYPSKFRESGKIIGFGYGEVDMGRGWMIRVNRIGENEARLFDLKGFPMIRIFRDT